MMLFRWTFQSAGKDWLHAETRDSTHPPTWQIPPHKVPITPPDDSSQLATTQQRTPNTIGRLKQPIQTLKNHPTTPPPQPPHTLQSRRTSQNDLPPPPLIKLGPNTTTLLLHPLLQPHHPPNSVILPLGQVLVRDIQQRLLGLRDARLGVGDLLLEVHRGAQDAGARAREVARAAVARDEGGRVVDVAVRGAGGGGVPAGGECCCL